MRDGSRRREQCVVRTSKFVIMSTGDQSVLTEFETSDCNKKNNQKNNGHNVSENKKKLERPIVFDLTL